MDRARSRALPSWRSTRNKGLGVIRQRLAGYVTGKRALSLRIFPFFALASFYGSIALEPTFANGHQYRWRWVLVAAIGYVSVFLTWLIVKLLIGDIEKRNFKVWHSFVISGIGGAGNAVYGDGGGGGFVSGAYAVTAGSTLTIIVGEGGGGKATTGAATPATFGGGGIGSSYGGMSNSYASGGGRSAIRLSGAATDLATAAGGGGGGYGGCGAGGGGDTGGSGAPNPATGGTQSAGGAGGFSINGYPGTAGSAYLGGNPHLRRLGSRCAASDFGGGDRQPLRSLGAPHRCFLSSELSRNPAQRSGTERPR